MVLKPFFPDQQAATFCSLICECHLIYQLLTRCSYCITCSCFKLFQSRDEEGATVNFLEDLAWEKQTGWLTGWLAGWSNCAASCTLTGQQQAKGLKVERLEFFSNNMAKKRTSRCWRSAIRGKIGLRCCSEELMKARWAWWLSRSRCGEWGHSAVGGAKEKGGQSGRKKKLEKNRKTGSSFPQTAG